MLSMRYMTNRRASNKVVSKFIRNYQRSTKFPKYYYQIPFLEQYTHSLLVVKSSESPSRKTKLSFEAEKQEASS